MTNFKTIDTLDLDTITGGAASIMDPCVMLKRKPLGEATPQDLAQAKVSCGLKLPTQRQIRDARRNRF